MKKDGKLQTKVYRKPTHTQQYINWVSTHPKNMLLGVSKGLIHRAHMLCDRREDLLEELALLKDVFIANGYPEKLVQKTLKESWAKETLKAVLKGVEQQVEIEGNKGYYEVLYAPYVRGFSEGLQRKLRKLQVGFVPKNGETIYSHLCKLKQRREREERKDVVFSIPCMDCGVCYVGETGQYFCERRTPHQRDIKNGKITDGFFCHIKENVGHKIDWDKVVFLTLKKLENKERKGGSLHECHQSNKWDG